MTLHYTQSCLFTPTKTNDETGEKIYCVLPTFACRCLSTQYLDASTEMTRKRLSQIMCYIWTEVEYSNILSSSNNRSDQDNEIISLKGVDLIFSGYLIQTNTNEETRKGSTLPSNFRFDEFAWIVCNSIDVVPMIV